MEIKKTNHVTTVKTTKFKTTVIKMSFSAPLNRETITHRILLANVLRNSSAKFSNRQLLSAHLEDLYGAILGVTTKKQGQLHIISFYIQVANEKFLKSAPPLFEAAVHTLSEIVMNPKLIDGKFDPEVVNQECRLLKEDIESLYDDKTSYALRQLITKMCKQERFGTNSDGYISDLKLVDGSTLVSTFESMKKDDEVKIVAIGDIEHDEVLRMIEQNFPLQNTMRSQLKSVDLEEKTFDELTLLTEAQDINQTKLNIGYRTNTRITDPDYFALLMFNAVFGGHASSKLFINVREKESLCYYCSSQLDNYKGLMYVYSGLDLQHVEKAKDIINQQLLAMTNGDITDEELDISKKVIVNAKKAALDSASGMLVDLEVQDILGITTQEFISRIEAVTATDIVKVASKIKLDTIFTLESNRKKGES